MLDEGKDDFGNPVTCIYCRERVTTNAKPIAKNVKLRNKWW
jgi:hypothetical protein